MSLLVDKPSLMLVQLGVQDLCLGPPHPGLQELLVDQDPFRHLPLKVGLAPASDLDIPVSNVHLGGDVASLLVLEQGVLLGFLLQPLQVLGSPGV